MTPSEIAQSMNNSKSNIARISVNQDLADAATEALREAFQESGDNVPSITKASLVEVALLSMLDPDKRKEILVNLSQNKVRDAYSNIVFDKSSIASGDAAQKLDIISQLTRRIDSTRKPTDRTLQTILNTQALMLRYMLGDPRMTFNEDLANGKLGEVMDVMYDRETTKLASELTRQTVNIVNRNKRDATQ